MPHRGHGTLWAPASSCECTSIQRMASSLPAAANTRCLFAKLTKRSVGVSPFCSVQRTDNGPLSSAVKNTRRQSRAPAALVRLGSCLQMRARARAGRPHQYIHTTPHGTNKQPTNINTDSAAGAIIITRRSSSRERERYGEIDGRRRRRRWQ